MPEAAHVTKRQSAAKEPKTRARRRYKKRPPSQLRSEDHEHAVLRLSLGRENGWTNSITSAPSNPRYHSPPTQPLASAETMTTTMSSQQTRIVNPNPVISTKSESQQGKQVFLWVYKDPHHIHRVIMDKHNASAQLKEYVERTFYIENDSFTLASLVPGVAYPIPIMKFNSDVNKGFIICLPTKSFIIHIAGSNNDETFSVKVNPLQTVKDLKVQIQQMKGYPMSIQDLHFDDHVLQNKHLVIDYKISNACRVHLFLQPCPSFSVYVETFWGKTYTIEVSPCSNSDELLNKVFRKTLAKPAYREQIFKTKTMYQGLILVEHDGTILDKKYCLSYYSIGSNATINILSTSQTRRDQRTVVNVVQDTGTRFQIKCAPFDTWFVISLQLHGMTTLYVDMMKFLISDRPADLQKAVGTYSQEQEEIQVTLVMLPPPSSLMHKLTVHVATASGGMETVHCGTRETIKDVKRRLEHLGVDYAAYHDILYKKVRLPSNTKLYEYKLNAMEKCLMDMKLNEFPVCIQNGSHSVKLPAHHDTSISTLLKRIEDKMGVSPIKHCIIHAGEDLYSYDSLSINETYLYINSQVHIEPISGTRSLHLIASDNKVPLPSKPTLDTLHIQQLSEVCTDPEAFVEALRWFLKWRYPIKSNIFNPRRPSDLHSANRRPSSKGLNLGLNHISSNRNAPASATHNSLHERSRCRSGSKHRRYTPIMSNPKNVDVLRNAVSDEEVYMHRQMTMLPDIAQNNKTSRDSNISPFPKPALKSSKSSENLFASESRETIDSFASVPASFEKKKLSVRFELPDDAEPPTREHRNRSFAWSSRNNSSSNPSKPMTGDELMAHYQRLRVARPVRRSHSDRVTMSQSPQKLSNGHVTNVSVKFSMNV